MTPYYQDSAVTRCGWSANSGGVRSAFTLAAESNPTSTGCAAFTSRHNTPRNERLPHLACQRNRSPNPA